MPSTPRKKVKTETVIHEQIRKALTPKRKVDDSVTKDPSAAKTPGKRKGSPIPFGTSGTLSKSSTQESLKDTDLPPSPKRTRKSKSPSYLGRNIFEKIKEPFVSIMSMWRGKPKVHQDEVWLKFC